MAVVKLWCIWWEWHVVFQSVPSVSSAWFKSSPVVSGTTLWRKLKPLTAWQVLPISSSFWILNFLISSNLLHYITTVNSMNKSGNKPYAEYCCMLLSRQIIKWLSLLSCLCRTSSRFLSSGWNSGYMAFHLYSINMASNFQSSSRFPKHSTPEIRATQSVLILMISFFFFIGQIPFFPPI